MATIPAGGAVWNVSNRQSRRRVSLKMKIFLAMVASAGFGGWWLVYGGEDAPATGAVGQALTVSASQSAGLDGTAAVAELRRVLLDAQAKLESVPLMSAVFQKQERIGDKLQPVNVMELKVRRTPLTVYMKWHEPETGQQIMWQDGLHDNKILVSPAGWKRKVMPLVKIEPTSDMAMAVSKRPVMNAGIWTFTERLMSLIDEELLRDPAVKITMTDGVAISGRACRQFKFEHAAPSSIVQFQNFTIFFDDVLGVPVACEHHRWVVDGPAPKAQLEESYLFRDLTLNAPLTDADFDHQNPALQFGVK